MIGKSPVVQKGFVLRPVKRVMSIAYGRPGLLQRSYCLSTFPVENLEDISPIYVTKKVAYLSGLHYKELM